MPGDQGRNRQKHRRLHQAGDDHRDILKALSHRGGLGTGREHESPKRLPDEEAPACLQQMAISRNWNSLLISPTKSLTYLVTAIDTTALSDRPMMTAARRMAGSNDRPSDSMPAHCQHETAFGLAHLCRRREEGIIIVRPNSSSRPEMNNPEITSTRVLTGTSRKTRAKAFSQTDGFRHLFGSKRTQRFSMLSRLPSKLLEPGICLPGPCTRGQPAARHCRAAVRRTRKNDRSQAGRFAQEQRGHADMTYRMRDVIELLRPKHSGWRQAPLPLCGIMGPGTIPLRSTPCSSRQSGIAI